MHVELPQPSEEITSPARILQLLGRAREQGCELEVRLRGSEQVWRTTIQRIDPAAGHIVYGQLTPSNWQAAPGLREPASIYCPAKEICIAYEQRLSPIGEAESLCYLESGVPESLHYHQLRGQFRITLAGRNASVSITTPGDVVYMGEMLNISSGGCRCLIKTEDLDLGDLRENLLCHLHVDNLLELECSARPVHLRVQGGAVMLSLELVDLDRAQEQNLQRCMVEIERSTMKRLGRPERFAGPRR